MNRFKSIFLLSKFMVLFICVVYFCLVRFPVWICFLRIFYGDLFVWFAFQCGFVLFASTMGTRGIEVDKNNVERYIRGLVPNSALVVFLFFFPTFILFFPFSLFSCKQKVSNNQLQNDSSKDEISNRC
jgi:hypothetical protein